MATCFTLQVLLSLHWLQYQCTTHLDASWKLRHKQLQQRYLYKIIILYAIVCPNTKIQKLHIPYTLDRFRIWGCMYILLEQAWKSPTLVWSVKKCSTHLSQICSSVQKWLWNHGRVQFERTAVPARIVPKVIGISLTERWHTALTGSLTIYWHHAHTY